MEGSLTGTIHGADGEDVSELTTLLAPRVGRLLFGGWPTGVPVTWSQHHGGPWPATTSVHTSVGATAIRRFLRPLTFQDAPESVLPDELNESPTPSAYRVGWMACSRSDPPERRLRA